MTRSTPEPTCATCGHLESRHVAKGGGLIARCEACHDGEGGIDFPCPCKHAFQPTEAPAPAARPAAAEAEVRALREALVDIRRWNADNAPMGNYIDLATARALAPEPAEGGAA